MPLAGRCQLLLIVTASSALTSESSNGNYVKVQAHFRTANYYTRRTERCFMNRPTSKPPAECHKILTSLIHEAIKLHETLNSRRYF